MPISALFFFFRCDFAVPLTHPLFDPTAPYIAIPLYMAHPFPPPPAATVPLAPALAEPAAAPPASPLQQVPSISLAEEEDRSEATSLSSAPSSGYALANAGMTNGFLSSEFI